MKIVINIEALAKANNVQVGQEITIPDIDGMPKDKYWRNRLKDAELDQSVSIVKPRKQTKETDK